MAATPRKRNPQDATLRNIRALKKTVALLGLRVRALQSLALTHRTQINYLKEALRAFRVRG